ncbi:CAAX protease self-immunity-domain-containing protein [Dipodascopsis uninucleata]
MSTLLTVIYVGVLYVHPKSRPTLVFSRDSSEVIQARVIAISIGSIICLAITLKFLEGYQQYNSDVNDISGQSIVEIFKIDHLSFNDLIRSSIGITGILFIGPVFETILPENLKNILTEVRWTFSNWVGWRNYVIAPFSEELVFRACIVSIELACGLSPVKAIFLCPLYFGVAHLHHAYEVYVVDPASFRIAVVQSFIQLIFTTVFGWYATFLFLRTDSLWPPVLAHAFCNCMGVPKIGERLEGSSWYTIIYNILLIVGAISFAILLYPMTETNRSLI